MSASSPVEKEISASRPSTAVCNSVTRVGATATKRPPAVGSSAVTKVPTHVDRQVAAPLGSDRHPVAGQRDDHQVGRRGAGGGHPDRFHHTGSAVDDDGAALDRAHDRDGEGDGPEVGIDGELQHRPRGGRIVPLAAGVEDPRRSLGHQSGRPGGDRVLGRRLERRRRHLGSRRLVRLRRGCSRRGGAGGNGVVAGHHVGLLVRPRPGEGEPDGSESSHDGDQRQPPGDDPAPAGNGRPGR